MQTIAENKINCLLNISLNLIKVSKFVTNREKLIQRKINMKADNNSLNVLKITFEDKINPTKKNNVIIIRGIWATIILMSLSDLWKEK